MATAHERVIDIVFDGPPDGRSDPRFVDVESPPGTSIRFGEWLQRDDGEWVLRFTQPGPTNESELQRRIDEREAKEKR